MTARDADTARKDAETAAGGAHPCSIESGMRILGGKWTGSILWHLQDRPVRFNELARMISGASKKMIADRLRLLEARGLITRRVLEGAPVAVEYELTPLGADALECLDALRRWTERLPPQTDETVD